MGPAREWQRCSNTVMSQGALAQTTPAPRASPANCHLVGHLCMLKLWDLKVLVSLNYGLSFTFIKGSVYSNWTLNLINVAKYELSEKYCFCLFDELSFNFFFKKHLKFMFLGQLDCVLCIIWKSQKKSLIKWLKLIFLRI